MKKIFTIILAVNLFFMTANAQDTVKNVTERNDVDASKAASVLKTGQANDILTNVYQLAVKNIFGTKKEVSASSTIFGLLSNIKKNYEVDTNYKKTRWARNIELSASGKIDSANHVSGFGAGVQFYLMNKRDVTNRDDQLHQIMSSYNKQIMDDLLNANLTFINSPDYNGSLPFDLTQSLKKLNETHDYHNLDPKLIAVLKKMHSKIVEGKGLYYEAEQYFQNRVNAIKEKPLWSLGGKYYHSESTITDTVMVESKFLAGISNDKGAGFWELNASTSLKMFNNTLNKSVAAQKFHFETGFNRVLSEKEDGTSTMELKFFGSYDKGFNTSNIPSATMANLTYRYLVSQFGGFWVPVTLSYDPGKGKIFGSIDITLNIDPLKKQPAK